MATFSSVQHDAIIDERELRRPNDPSVEDFFASGSPEPFFVKSLETVQGDQRDVIFISIGYAKDRDGAFFQNFGPLNRDGEQRPSHGDADSIFEEQVATALRNCGLKVDHQRSPISQCSLGS